MNSFLNFSDSAKYADIARNIFYGHGYISDFRFWNDSGKTWILPGTPYSIWAFFKIFGVNDLSVILVSLFFSILSLFFLFALVKKIYGSNFIAFLSCLSVGLNYDLVNYATSGSSESLFVFGIIATIYFLTFKDKNIKLLSIPFITLILFTRPQAIIYLLGFVVFYFLTNFSWKKSITYSILSTLLISIVYLLFFRQGLISVTQSLPGVTVSDSLRATNLDFNIFALLKKIFYNMYNFYKALPNIASPYVWGLFVISLFIWGKDKLLNSFKISVLFMVVLTFLITALTIPFYRYLHPVVPLVYIVATITLHQILSKFIKKKKHLYLSSLFLILFFVVGQTLGILLLDSRFKNKLVNKGKPPVYALLSYKLKDLTNKDEIVLTNLDTWGSWYGERKTVWYPLKPSMIVDPDTGEIPFDAIYLTSYKKDDENYYMGEEWRLIYDNPNNEKAWTCEGCDVISEEFNLKSVVKIPADETYEKEEGIGVLLEKVK